MFLETSTILCPYNLLSQAKVAILLRIVKNPFKEFSNSLGSLTMNRLPPLKR